MAGLGQVRTSKASKDKDMKEKNESLLMTKKEAAEALGFGVRWLELQIASGAPCVRIGKSVRIRRADVEHFARVGAWPVTI
jgi:excisionase family DNA binding protein